MTADRVVVITGGTRGWGRAIALSYAAPGTSLVLNFVRDVGAADETAGAASGLGADVTLVQADIGTPAGVSAVLAAARELGRVDVLVHNSFLAVNAHPLEVTDEVFDAVMAVGPKALLAMLRGGIELFPDEGGHVVCTLSLATKRIFNKRGTNYFPMAAAKAALEVCVQYLAVDLAPRNITVNGVAAGFFADEAVTADTSDPFRASIASKTPLGRIPATREVAEVVHFLGSSAGGWITGQVLVADGGFSLI